jgi:hypothetical protein
MITLPSLAQQDRAAGTRIWLCTGPTDSPHLATVSFPHRCRHP